ncbi:hypothetical protein M5E87_28645 [Flavonifractor plautii]|nr:hypothetical protein M5E87_28645 [Flavonifractor plautii]
MNEMSVRTWQERFRAGDFSSRDRAVQCEAYWYDWFCRDDALAGRLKKISSVVLGITDPFILDNYYVWFKNNCPLEGPLYDDVRFEPLTGERDGKYFLVALDSHHELIKWTLYTERYGYDAPEFCCGNVREMTAYINAMAPELAQGSSLASCWRKRLWGNMSGSMKGKPPTASGGRGITCSPTNPPATGNIGLSRFRTLRRMFPRAFPRSGPNSTACSMFSQARPPLWTGPTMVRRAQRRKEQTR